MTETQFLNKSCNEFNDLLASAEPVPGGGAAAAYTGALGMALVNMVCRLTIGKKKYADVEDEIKSLLERGEEIRLALLQAVEEDAAAFKPLADAYALPSETPEEKAYKSDVLSERSFAAAELPMQAAELAVEGLHIAERVAAIGSRLVISDAGCGASMLEAALRSFDFTARINLNAIKDKEYVENARKHLSRLLIEAEAAEAYARISANERLL
jgi:formiminotetrahydrofolate cyclodeaminase